MLIPLQVLDTQEDSSKWLLYQIEPGSMKTVLSVFLYHIYACAAVKRMCVPPPELLHEHPIPDGVV